jgi:hypothetical protein
MLGGKGVAAGGHLAHKTPTTQNPIVIFLLPSYCCSHTLILAFIHPLFRTVKSEAQWLSITAPAP